MSTWRNGRATPSDERVGCWSESNRRQHYAGVAKLVDARGLNPLDFVHSGSSPDTRTKTAKSLFTIG